MNVVASANKYLKVQSILWGVLHMITLVFTGLMYITLKGNHARNFRKMITVQYVMMYIWLGLSVIFFVINIKRGDYLSANLPFFIYLFETHHFIGFITDIGLGVLFFIGFMKTSGRMVRAIDLIGTGDEEESMINPF